MSESITTLGELIHWAELTAEDFQYWEDADAIRSFGKTWRDLQNVRLEDVSISIKRDYQECRPTLCGYKIDHLYMIANILQKENLPPERVSDALTNIAEIISIVTDEFNEALQRSMHVEVRYEDHQRTEN